MFRQLKKTLVATAIASLTLGSIGPAFADSADTLPDMGTSAGSTLSIGQEMQMGDYYVRQLRGSAPLINDPLLVQYINGLGMRLVAHANSVRTPFHFYLINNDQINAFAFFGGNVVLHSALFRYSDNESELASVMAHEISHVTQRHLARAMEDQKRNAPLTWVGALGSILLAMASPQAGMAALTGTLAGTQQGMISFTRQNEEEADRIGIQVLQRSGFDPQAMPMLWVNCLTSRATRRDRRKCCSPTPYRKADWPMPVTVPTRCARWWYSPRRTSIWRRRVPSGCTPTATTSWAPIC